MITRQTEPYPDAVTAESFHPLVRKWFFDTFKAFSPPQKYAIVNLTRRMNTLISSPTGSGKTLAAFGAVLNYLTVISYNDCLDDHIYCIYVSPLKALSRDIQANLYGPLEELQKRAKEEGKELPIRIGLRTGDTTPRERQIMRKNPPHILITTPESLAIMLSSPKFSEHMKQVEWVIVDEIHALADSKRGVHLSVTLERLEKISSFTRVGLSATVSPLDEVARYLVGYKDSSLGPHGMVTHVPEAARERDCHVVDVRFIKQMDLKVKSPVSDLINTPYNVVQDKLYDLLDEMIQNYRSTLIFTNTRAGTERVVHQLKERFPKHYSGIIGEDDEKVSNIGAHHGSLSKEHRHMIENKLKAGELKVVVSSTSLELGVDIGYIDLVVLLGSPKSVARALQRIGRSGHRLHETAIGRIIVLDRDDLVECSVLLKNALDKKIDTIHIPRNCLDVLAQQIYGIAIDQSQHINEVFDLIRKSYCYGKLSREDFLDVVKYLAGEHIGLEERHVYAKIWYDQDTGQMGRRGKLARLMFMTNIGTIPDEANVRVKVGDFVIGTVSEPFMERLKRGDVFVLGGETYEFNYTRGLTMQVKPVAGRAPTVPSWYSEMLPLSFDLALEIQKFRGRMSALFERKHTKQEILDFIHDYLSVDEQAALAIHNYFSTQHNYSAIPTDTRLLVEHYREGDKRTVVFHTMAGRRVHDVISRALAYIIGKVQHRDTEIIVSDNAFAIICRQPIQAARATRILINEDLRKIMDYALEKTEVLKRRFRHCAARALMILRSYKGERKSVGKQQVSSMLLMSAIKYLGGDAFPIYREAKREVLEDFMDFDGAKKIVRMIKNNRLVIDQKHLDLPSPFSANLILQGYSDILRVEDRAEFLKRMHELVTERINEQGKVPETQNPKKFSYDSLWDSMEKTEEEKQRNAKEDRELTLKEQLYHACKKDQVEPNIMYDCMRLIEGERKGFRDEFRKWLRELLEGTIPKYWGDDIIKFLEDVRYEI